MRLNFLSAVYDDCNANECVNGGSCVLLQTGAMCVCQSGFAGSSCSLGQLHFNYYDKIVDYSFEQIHNIHYAVFIQ